MAKKNGLHNDDISARISQLRDQVFVKNTIMAEKTGIEYTHLSSICNGNMPVTMTTLRKIAAAVPELNLQWLILGDGEMLKKAGDPYAEGERLSVLEGQLQSKDEQIKSLNEQIATLHQILLNMSTK